MNENFGHVTRLLLVDDDPSMVRLLTRIIENSWGDRISLESRTDPREARQWMENNLIDILITDLEMPGVNGLELLRCAKRRNPCAQVLFITGQTTLDSLVDAMELGATDYLLKPLDQQELIELIEHAEKRLERWRKALSGTFAAERDRRTAGAL